MITVTEADGRIYVTFAGPHRAELARALRQAFPGHRQLYRCVDGRYRLWARDREHLAVFLECWCQKSWIVWEQTARDPRENPLGSQR